MNAETEVLSRLDSALGRGDWLETGDYEQLRARYNALAEAAEDAVNVFRSRAGLTDALRNIRRVLADDGDGAGPGAMFSMIDRHLKAAGF